MQQVIFGVDLKLSATVEVANRAAVGTAPSRRPKNGSKWG